MDYIYRGDKLTDAGLINKSCSAVRRRDGKCIRGKNGNMLVQFEGGSRAIVTARMLRKIKP